MKILNASQIRASDQFTIENEPIASIDLMERASNAFVEKFLDLFPYKRPANVFCGTGNNGGDGLAISRLLKTKGWEVTTFIIGNIEKGSKDFLINLEKVSDYIELNSIGDKFEIQENSIVIDALFGSGLTRPIKGFYAQLIQNINLQKVIRISVDIASGLYVDHAIEMDSTVFKPHITISFQCPKLIFFLPDYFDYVGEFHVVNIELNQSFITDQKTNFWFIQKVDLMKNIPKRSKFTHKNKVGRLQIVAGSKGKMGAAILCTTAAFRAGVGLVNVQSPICGIDILQVAIPEAMVIPDKNEDCISKIHSTNDVIAIGPGLGTDEKTIGALTKFLLNHSKPLVIDADGINILSMNKELLSEVPKNSILTPHVGEFRKLVGDWENDLDKLDKLQSFCKKHQLNVVLKGAYSAVCNTEGEVHFNSTGNPVMATAGSGDVLTGIIASFLAQGLKPFEALKFGVFVHGLAGDMARDKVGEVGVMASDIINYIPLEIQNLKKTTTK